MSADALLTQRELADYLVKRQAHYHFTVKANQAGTLEDLELYFQDRGKRPPDYVEHTPPDHGRIETRKIWTTPELNHYLRFPHLGQAFGVERQVIEKKSGETSSEIAYGITSRPPEQANPQRVLKVNRGHWVIENPPWRTTTFWIGLSMKTAAASVPSRSAGPENMTRLRRFASGVIKSKGGERVPQKMRQLTRHVRLVFDYLRMTENTCARRSRN